MKLADLWRAIWQPKTDERLARVERRVDTLEGAVSMLMREKGQ